MITRTFAARNRHHRKVTRTVLRLRFRKVNVLRRACQTNLTADELDYLVSELEECRSKNKILREKLENKKDLKRELNTEHMIR